MKMFPVEYETHATVTHKTIAALAALFIAITLLGILAFIFFDAASLPLNVVFFIIAGAPAGLILISVVNFSLGRRYREHLLTMQARNRGKTMSSYSREEILKNMRYKQYDYRNKRQSFLSAMAIIAVLYVFLVSWLYLTYAPLHPAILAIFCFPLFLLGARWLQFSKRWQGSIILTIDGLQIEKDGNCEILPWDSLREIKDIGFGFSVRSDLAEIEVWDGISPSDVYWTSLRELFGMGEMTSRKLFDKIKVMNPSIVVAEPFLSRNLQIPVSERLIATLMILAIILFLIVMVLARQESAVS